jgi:peptide deformylase
MRLKIVQVGEPALRRRAKMLSAEQILSDGIQQLIAYMQETMRDAPGVGLAAPQVGLSLQLAVIEDRHEYMAGVSAEVLAQRDRSPVPFHVIINPELFIENDPVENNPAENRAAGAGSPANFFEGCLSLAGFTAVVPRARAVRVKCLNQRAEPVIIEAHGWYARILQHEIDHLHGRLYIDRMEPRSFMSLENYARHWKDVPIHQVPSGPELPGK